MENSPSEVSVQSRRRSPALADLLSGLVIFGTLFAGAFAFICLQDDIKGYDFQISDTLKPYVQKLDLTEKASKTLLATHPALQEKQAFNQSCHSHSHEVYVLGCYVHDNDRIYLYQRPPRGNRGDYGPRNAPCCLSACPLLGKRSPE